MNHFATPGFWQCYRQLPKEVRELAADMRPKNASSRRAWWAQVNGWRGDTSIPRRVEHDLFYLRNWSLSFDLKIMFLTVWRTLIDNRNAY